MTYPAASQKRFGAEFWLWLVLMLVGLPPLLFTAVIASRAIVSEPFDDLVVCPKPSVMDVLVSSLPGGVLLLTVGGIAVAAQRMRLNWLKPVMAACTCVVVAQSLILLQVWRTTPGYESYCQSLSFNDARSLIPVETLTTKAMLL